MLKLTRVCAGYYEHKLPNGPTFAIRQGDEGTIKGLWFWTSDNGAEYSDPVSTKREAVKGLVQYIKGRTFDPSRGWWYYDESKVRDEPQQAN